MVKRGQIETMGLLVIVILISLVMFFGFSFAINNSKTVSSQKKEVGTTLTISNIGTTIIESTSPCKYKIRDLLEDCSFNKEIMCDGVDSCVYANNTIKYILNQTLDLWGNYEYNVTVRDSQGREYISLSTGCNKSYAGTKTDITPFVTTTFQSMQLRIIVCG